MVALGFLWVMGQSVGSLLVPHLLKYFISNINTLYKLKMVPTVLFRVKTGIYMPNNFKGLDRRPFAT